MIRFIIFIASITSLVCLPTQSQAFSQTSGQAIPLDCSPQLQRCVSKILKVPEAKEFIECIQKEGAIHFRVSNYRLAQQFGAFWNPDSRTIFVNLGWHRSEGALIGSILFELQNASVTSKFDHYDALASKGQIGKEQYVETIERIEYENSHRAAALAEKGIAMGVFPREARLQTYSNFEEHFTYQKIGGHSAQIAGQYDQLRNRGARLS